MQTLQPQTLQIPSPASPPKLSSNDETKIKDLILFVGKVRKAWSFDSWSLEQMLYRGCFWNGFPILEGIVNPIILDGRFEALLRTLQLRWPRHALLPDASPA
jgi:hypothetical protein